METCPYRTKAEVLCWGLRATEIAKVLYGAQHPTDHKRTGNSGLHMLLNNRLVVNAIYGEQFSEKSPYHIEEIHRQSLLFKGNTPVCMCSPVQPPNWYLRRTKDGTLMEEIFMLEGKDTLITAVWNNCCYFNNGTQCKYCILGYNKGVEFKDVNQIVETANAALKENPRYYIHLTGGNTFQPDHGVLYYEKYVKALRGSGISVPISLEVAPPNDTKALQRLVNVGASGFSINIEVWNEDRRKVICPGKSKIPREVYFRAWKAGVKLLGKFRISSMLIVGIDTKESIKKGIQTLASIGVKPTLIPLRPFAKGQLSHMSPPDPDDFIELSLFAGRQLAKYGARYADFVGCEHCGACTMENDYLKAYNGASV